MFFKFLFDIAKPPVHHASGAFYFFTFLLFYLFTFLPFKAFLPLKAFFLKNSLNFATLCNIFSNFAPKS